MSPAGPVSKAGSEMTAQPGITQPRTQSFLRESYYRPPHKGGG